MTLPQQPPWLRGPLPGIIPVLQPVAHALIDADEDVQKALASVTIEQLRAKPGTAAPAAFHVKHAMGSLDRLLAYARGESLSEAQMATHASEKQMDVSAFTPQQLASDFAAAVAKALEQLRRTKESELLTVRLVGRAKVPSNTLGILYHAGEHTARHVGQLMTTVKVLGTRD
jgi:uncharacterized damage-inducible protein DinB